MAFSNDKGILLLHLHQLFVNPLVWTVLLGSLSTLSDISLGHVFLPFINVHSLSLFEQGQLFDPLTLHSPVFTATRHLSITPWETPTWHFFVFFQRSYEACNQTILLESCIPA